MTRLENQKDDVFVEVMDFGNSTSAKEMVTQNSDGSFTVFVNSRIASCQQKEAVEHAIRHIQADDFEKENVQTIECEAHQIAEASEVHEMTPEEKFHAERSKIYEEMRKRNLREMKRIERKIREREEFMNSLPESVRRRYSAQRSMW